MHLTTTALLVILSVESRLCEDYDNLDYNSDASEELQSNEVLNNNIDDINTVDVKNNNIYVNNNANNNNTEVINNTKPRPTAKAPEKVEDIEIYHNKSMQKHEQSLRDLNSNEEGGNNAHDCGDMDYLAGSRSEEDRCSSTRVNYPFSVSVQKTGAHYASGALVDRRWILTAAGEFFNVRESVKLFRARLGSVDCKRGGTVVAIKRIELHPSYELGSPNFDVALLRMAQPVVFTDYIKPIQFSKTKITIGTKFVVTYWPRLIINGQVLPPSAKERLKKNSMRVSSQRMIPWDKCRRMIKTSNITLNQSTLCLKPVVTHHSICTPDAGAPVVAGDGLWGITSGWISDDCHQNQSPTVFSRLASPVMRSWLDTHVGSF